LVGRCSGVGGIVLQKQVSMANLNIEVSLEGFTGGSLLFEAKHPGIPDRLFVPEEKEEDSTLVPPGTESWPQR
jgi:hypothetical protein